MNRHLILSGGILWVAGLILSIVGMNLHTQSGNLVAVIGNIVFLAGLGITGAAWLISRKKADQKAEEPKKEA